MLFKIIPSPLWQLYATEKRHASVCLSSCGNTARATFEVPQTVLIAEIR